MIKNSVRIKIVIFLFCTSFLSFSQQDSLKTVNVDDEMLVQFENYFFEALAYKATENHSRAIESLNKCIQFEYADTSIYFELSKNYYYISNYTEALYFIDLALKEAPTEYWFLVHAKAIYLAMYDYKRAIEIQKRMIALKPALKIDLVLVYIQSRDYKSASDLIQELKRAGWSGSQLYRYEKIVQKHTGHVKTSVNVVKISADESMVDLKKAYESQHEYSTLIKILEIEIAAKNYDSILYYCNNGLEYYPAQPKLYLYKGKALLNKNEFQASKAALEEGLDYLIDAPKQEIEFLESLFICYQKLGLEASKTKCEEKIKILKQKL